MGGGSYEPSELRSSTGYSAASSIEEDHLPDAQVTDHRTAVNTENRPKIRGAISTDSPNPLVVAFDDTGSMGDWVDEFYKRAPMFYGQIRLHDYLEDPALSLAVVSDYFSDPEALQVTAFCRGDALDHAIESLLIQRMGGSGSKESYQLAAYYYTQKFEAGQHPNRPLFFFFGDEGFYEELGGEEVRSVFGDEAGPYNSMDLFSELCDKFDCFAFRKPYSSAGMDEVIHDQWQRALARERVVMLETGGQVVDTMLGIIAMRSGTDLNSFLAQLKGRKQSDARIRQVRRSLLPAAQSLFATVNEGIELGEVDHQVEFKQHEAPVLEGLPLAQTEGATIIINVTGDFVTGTKSSIQDSVVTNRKPDS